eukprot:927195-Karenia_brevis.AAC.1
MVAEDIRDLGVQRGTAPNSSSIIQGGRHGPVPGGSPMGVQLGTVPIRNATSSNVQLGGHPGPVPMDIRI